MLCIHYNWLSGAVDDHRHNTIRYLTVREVPLVIITRNNNSRFANAQCGACVLGRTSVCARALRFTHHSS